MLEFTMQKGLWLKGAIHCHSTVSDGLLNPEDVARFYEARGYTLLSITDHHKIVSKVKCFNGIYQPGVEISRDKCKLGEPYHIVALGVDDPAILDIKDAQLLIDYVNDVGGLTFIAHPYWSSLLHEDLIRLEGYVGIEVYNTGCDVEVAKGYSLTHWDDLLSSGKKVWGLAVDDSHSYLLPLKDADGGWIWVNVDDENSDEILKSIREGRFYSSMAPKITTFKYASNYLRIESSPISRLNIVTINGRGLSISLEAITNLIRDWRDPYKRKLLRDEFVRDFDYVNEEEGRKIYLETVTNKTFAVEMKDAGIVKFEAKGEFKYPYIRIEIIDNKGRYAWVNPIIKQ